MPETENPACMGCPHPASSHRGSTCIECGDAPPLTMEPLRWDPDSHTGRVRFRNDYWTWCRRHERAEHASEPPVKEDVGYPAATRIDPPCVRIGPFMTEREANRLSGRTGLRNMDADRDFAPLGMKLET